MKKENIEFLSGIESVLAIKPTKLLWLTPLLIGGLVIAIILWLVFSKVDVIAPSQGKTIPSSRMILIQPKDISIINKIYVKNSQTIKKGDLLVEFKDNIESYENSSIKAKYKNLLAEKLFLEKLLIFIDSEKNEQISNDELSINELEKINLKLQTDILSFNSEKDSLKMKINKIKHEKNMLNLEIAKKEKLLPFTEYKLQQMEVLVNKGLESEVVFKDLQKDFIEQSEDIEIKKAEFKKLNAQENISKKDLEKFITSSLRDTNKKLLDISNELKTLKPEISKSDYMLESKLIKASTNGTIYNLNNVTKGKVVQSGEIIMQLIPSDSPLEVETKVLNKDIGFVSIGQKVKVKFDSFKFTKYGYIEGKVTNIEKASILDENLGEIYPVVIELETDKMKIDNKYIKLIPGMTCTVDIKIGKRRLIDYIISPMIRYKDEALREK